MNRFRMAGSTLIVMLLVAACMYALNVALKPPIGPRSRLLFIGNATGDYWQRTVAGALDAARELGIDLEVESPTPGGQVEQQISFVQRINPADYDGVAISPTDLESQIELLNALAGRTKLVTLDRDSRKSLRLCHVGYCQSSSGGLAARLVSEQLTREGKVALLATSFADVAQNSNVTERLAGFIETWEICGQDSATPCPIIQVATDSKDVEHTSHDLAATLADPELAFIVALDSKAAESALKALATRPETGRVPIIAFDPGEAIFDAIDDGRVCSAIFDDPYRSGFTAIHHLSAYRGAEKACLPVPGYGNHFLTSEVVRKENLADFRRRTRS